MLRPPSRAARNLLDLANLIDEVEPYRFNMRHWCSCICGHYMRSHGRQDVGNWTTAAAWLGITEDMARELFGEHASKDAPHMSDSPKEAAERIRSYALVLVD